MTPYKIGRNIIVEMIERWILMTRTFIEVPLFTKRWKEIGLDDNDLHSLQIMLLKDPESGPVMEGTGGIRKVRFPLENKGKSGSVRVCYTDFAEYEMLYLITAFEKKEQENLSTEEKNVLRKLVKSLKNEAAKNRS
ncbi:MULTISPECIES: type II toxin-antitoxin system RelE/ParE family toxin [Clostridia]|uniref:type II toxin-antitoxin system RelE/ParE family toxin n=1 Tax=Clostridia TaxID=186801 RepID=UPI002E8DFED7|nr:type II toxin-antitoxin system RelE/ParE family toxin [uncultured Blautia sp.]